MTNNNRIKIFIYNLNKLSKNIFRDLLNVNIKFTKYLVKKLTQTQIDYYINNVPEILLSISAYYFTENGLKLFIELGANMSGINTDGYEYDGLDFLEIAHKKNTKKYDNIVSWMKSNGYYNKYEKLKKVKKFNL